VQHGLPVTDVLVGYQDRGRFIRGFPDAIDSLPLDQRGRALYLSKCLAAVAAGLFDAALNYLWDETISELRRRVARYDLRYFFDLAVKAPERRKGLSSEADLVKVTDQELVNAAKEIGLISDVGAEQLDLIRYMRNYASAAHPNQNSLGAMQLLGWVETCIKEVITLPESPLVADIRKLLGNVRSGPITPASLREASAFFEGLGPEHADSLAAGLFGMFVDPTSAVHLRDNVLTLLPALWPEISDDQKVEFGAKYARYAANADQQQAQLSRELLDRVGGSSYIPESLRSSEIQAAVDELILAHRGWDNFYNEPPMARRLAALVGDKGVPKEVRRSYVHGLVECFLTNGKGVAANAEPTYLDLIRKFTRHEAEIALLSFRDRGVVGELGHSRGRLKFLELLSILEPKVRPEYKRIIGAIREYEGSFSGLSRHESLLKVVRSVAG
jgi:hypothetical protein